MPLRHVLSATALVLACWAAPLCAQVAPVPRTEVGNRISENLPPIPPALIEQLNCYQNTRGASFAGWTRDGCVLVGTRFAETTQAHRVCAPLGMCEQRSFRPRDERQQRLLRRRDEAVLAAAPARWCRIGQRLGCKGGKARNDAGPRCRRLRASTAAIDQPAPGIAGAVGAPYRMDA